MYETGGGVTILAKIFMFTLGCVVLMITITVATNSSNYDHRSAPPTSTPNSNFDKNATITGNWFGEYSHITLSNVKFTVELKESKNRSISGRSKESISSDGLEQTLEATWTGSRNGKLVTFEKRFVFNGRQQKIHYEGSLNPNQSTINGNWLIPGTDHHGTFVLNKEPKQK